VVHEKALLFSKHRKKCIKIIRFTAPPSRAYLNSSYFGFWISIFLHVFSLHFSYLRSFYGWFHSVVVLPRIVLFPLPYDVCVFLLQVPCECVWLCRPSVRPPSLFLTSSSSARKAWSSRCYCCTVSLLCGSIGDMRPRPLGREWSQRQSTQPAVLSSTAVVSECTLSSPTVTDRSSSVVVASSSSSDMSHLMPPCVLSYAEAWRRESWVLCTAGELFVNCVPSGLAVSFIYEFFLFF
jgi:hypothetical protein